MMESLHTGQSMQSIARTLGAAVCCLAALSQHGVRVDADAQPLLTTLKAELRRNFDALRHQPTPPYFISYKVTEDATATIRASFGALVSSEERRSRVVDIDVRVGSYELDNTRQIRGPGGGGMPGGFGRVAVPLGDRDDAALRNALWRHTDRRYKQAVERLANVKTNLAAKVEEEHPAPDFSKEQPQVHVSQPVGLKVDRPLWEQRLRRISQLFADDPLIFRGDAVLTIEVDNRVLVTTEGAELVTPRTATRLSITAMTKAADGMELPLYATYDGSTPERLPHETELLAETRRMIRLLGELRAASVIDPFSGPAVLSGRATGVFFHEIFGHRVEGHRQKYADDAQTFTKKIGEPVLPTFLDVIFDPTLQKAANRELNGHFAYDDEGVKARRVTVVEQGILKTFLMSRSPLPRFPSSNGHGRGAPGLRPVSRQSNLIVESRQTVPTARLIDMLKEEARRQGKPFGLLFENIEGGFTFTGRVMPNAFNVMPNVVYRVYVDGRPPELVRGVDLIGTPLAAFGKILATGDTPDVFNGTCGAESGAVPVSAVAPPILVAEVEVQKKTKSQETLPILQAPPRSAKPSATM